MSSIKVVCRFRPLNSKEQGLGTSSIVNISEDESSVSLQGSESNNFNFDKVYGPSTSQESIYSEVAKPIVEDIFKGYNGTVFVYGQTSSGKTHTMMGPDGGKGMNDPTLKGIIPRMVKTIFDSVMKADSHIEFLVKVSYIEIYMERIRDLLDPMKTNLQVREEKTKGIWIEDATEIYVTSEDDVLDVMRSGSANRAIAATKMNMESSRSHSIFIVNVFQKNMIDLTNKSGKLYLVDLAGSEKVGKTGAEGQTLNEAKTINKSLSTLGNVINALTDGKSSHVPYRDSKLTRVLQESLGGNSRTTLIVNCSPSSYNEVETLSTLRFGTRAKNIKNKPKINQERSVAELKASLARADSEIEALNSKLHAMQSEIEILKRSGGVTVAAVSAVDVKEKEELIRQLESEKNELRETQNEMMDQLREKEAEIEAQNGLLESLRNQLSETKSNLDETAKENEILLERLAEETVDIENHDYKLEEMRLTIESLTAQLSVVQQQQQARDLREELQGLNSSPSPTSSSSSSTSRSSVYSDSLQERENSLKESIEKSFTAAISSPSQQRRPLPAALLSPRKAREEEEGTPKKKRSPTTGKLSSFTSSTTPPSPSTSSTSIPNQRMEVASELREADAEVDEDSDEQEDAEEEETIEEEGGEGDEVTEIERLRTENVKLQEENKKRKEKQKELKKELLLSKKRSEGRAQQLQQEREQDSKTYEKQLRELAEQTKKKLSEFDVIKKELLEDLQDRCLKVVELQIRLDEALEEHQYILKHSDSKTGVEQHKKNVMLEKVVEKLNAAQTKLSNENQSLKSQLEVAQKKTTSQDTRIKGLEERLTAMTQRLKDQASYFEEEIKKSRFLVDTLAAMNKQQPPSSTSAPTSSSTSDFLKGRIVKPLRGGGGGGGGSETTVTGSAEVRVGSEPVSAPSPAISTPSTPSNLPISPSRELDSPRSSVDSPRIETAGTGVGMGTESPRSGEGSGEETSFWSRFASRPRRVSGLGLSLPPGSPTTLPSSSSSSPPLTPPTPASTPRE